MCQGCQFGLFEARFFNSGFFERFWLFLKIKKETDKIWPYLAFCQSERLGLGKTLSGLHIHCKSLLKRVYKSAEWADY